jgi:hypothetical protein
VSAAKHHTLNENEIIQTAPGVFDTVGNTTRDGWELDSKIFATREVSFYGSYDKATRAQINDPLPNTASLLSVPEHAVKA